MSHSAVAHSLAGPGPARPRPLHRNWPAAPAGRLTRPGSGVAAWHPGPLPNSCSPRCLTRPSDLAAGAANSFSMTSLRALFVALVALAAVAHGRKLLRECGGRLVCRRRRGQCAWVSCGAPAWLLCVAAVSAPVASGAAGNLPPAGTHCMAGGQGVLQLRPAVAVLPREPHHRSASCPGCRGQQRLRYLLHAQVSVLHAAAVARKRAAGPHPRCRHLPLAAPTPGAPALPADP